MSTGLALLVKTPGYSPVKTRLAAHRGRGWAEKFHLLAAQAVAEVADRAAQGHDWRNHFAVAEASASSNPNWAAWPCLQQGRGGLGARMGRIYTHLQRQYGSALLIGADVPQVNTGLLVSARNLLHSGRSPFILGPAQDGGFWLFGGRRPLPMEVWTSVSYSRSDTAACFSAALAEHGSCERIATLTDIDRQNDLPVLRQALGQLTAPTPAQAELASWLERETIGICDIRIPEKQGPEEQGQCSLFQT